MSGAMEFGFDVFLSHSARDKAVVWPLAERLRADGLNVWFDEWELKPGEHRGRAGALARAGALPVGPGVRVGLGALEDGTSGFATR